MKVVCSQLTILALLALPACATMSDKPAKEVAFESKPIVVKVLDPGAFNRGLQAAVREGFKPTSVESAAGFFAVERLHLDENLTAKKAEERVYGNPRRYFRKLIITAVVGTDEAVISPSVLSCVEAKCAGFGLAYPELNSAEYRALQSISSAFGPPEPEGDGGVADVHKPHPKSPPAPMACPPEFQGACGPPEGQQAR